MYLSKSCSQPIKSHDKRANSLIDTSLKGYNLGEKTKSIYWTGIQNAFQTQALILRMVGRLYSVNSLP